MNTHLNYFPGHSHYRNISNSDDRILDRQFGGFGGPFLGGLAGGLLAGTLFSPYGLGGYGYPYGYGGYGYPYYGGYGFPYGYGGYYY